MSLVRIIAAGLFVAIAVTLGRAGPEKSSLFVPVVISVSGYPDVAGCPWAVSETAGNLALANPAYGIVERRDGRWRHISPPTPKSNIFSIGYDHVSDVYIAGGLDFCARYSNGRWEKRTIHGWMRNVSRIAGGWMLLSHVSVYYWADGVQEPVEVLSDSGQGIGYPYARHDGSYAILKGRNILKWNGKSFEKTPDAFSYDPQCTYTAECDGEAFFSDRRGWIGKFGDSTKINLDGRAFSATIGFWVTRSYFILGSNDQGLFGFDRSTRNLAWHLSCKECGCEELSCLVPDGNGAWLGTDKGPKYIWNPDVFSWEKTDGEHVDYLVDSPHGPMICKGLTGTFDLLTGALLSKNSQCYASIRGQNLFVGWTESSLGSRNIQATRSQVFFALPTLEGFIFTAVRNNG
jgi:hypothetical protein